MIVSDDAVDEIRYDDDDWYDDDRPPKEEPDCTACNDSGTAVYRGDGPALYLIAVEVPCYCSGGDYPVTELLPHIAAALPRGPFHDEPPF